MHRSYYENNIKLFQKLYVSKIRIPLITRIIISFNCFIFAVQFFTGENGRQFGDRFDEFGVLIPHLVSAGEWWRVLTVSFLHGNIAHLAINMLVLYCFGGFIEPIFGKLRLFITYLFCTLGASLVAVLISFQQGNDSMVYLGASGSIMGLIGVLFTLFLDALKRSKNKQVLFDYLTNGIQLIMFNLVLQTCIDLYFGYGIVGHVGGFLAGLTIATFYLKYDRKFKYRR